MHNRSQGLNKRNRHRMWKTCGYSSCREMRWNTYMWGKSHSNINANGKTNWETNQKETRATRTNTHAWRTGPRRPRVAGVQCQPWKTMGKLHTMHQRMHGGLWNVTLSLVLPCSATLSQLAPDLQLGLLLSGNCGPHCCLGNLQALPGICFNKKQQ